MHEDHPRIRGEHHSSTVSTRASVGSSPHTRGARRLQLGPPRTRRIIPAYAGSTCRISRSDPAPPDHPRIRGEHRYGLAAGCDDGGSSPHTRGARHVQPPPVVGGRIIPAYAGSTFSRILPALPKADHPRIRGEHPLFHHERPRREGSSPHTRGAPELQVPRHRPHRIIPAYAGSTALMAVMAVTGSDHPRIRGEHRL